MAIEHSWLDGALVRRGLREPLPLPHVLPPLPCEETRKTVLPDPDPAGTVTVDFPASRTVRKKCLLFMPLCLRCSHHSSLR